MFKNLLDKAKSAIEDIDITLKNGNNPKAKKLMEYDANFFTFTLEGGPLHTTLVKASAKIKAGETAGEPVPLTCKWFISTLDGKMTEIVGLTGSAYQPCAEDVGSRIVVQATPALPDAKYTGTAIFGEVGPLELDKMVEEKVMAFLNSSVADYKVLIEKISFDVEHKPETFPCGGFVSLNKQGKTIEVYTANGEEKGAQLAFCGHSDQYPSIEFIRESTNVFELQFSAAQSFKIVTDTSSDRDILATAIRMFGNEDLLNEELAHEEKEKSSGGREIKNRKRTQSSNLQILMKREKLIKQIKQLEKENGDLKRELEKESDNKITLQTQVNGFTNKLKEKEANITQLQEEINRLKNEKEGLDNEKLFLSQEVNLFKSQNVELENVIKNFESNSNKSRESIEKEIIIPVTTELDETIKSLKARLISAELANEQLQQEKDNLHQRFVELEQVAETKDANINSLKKKIQSLVQENEKANSQKSRDFDLKFLPVPSLTTLTKSASINETVTTGLSGSPRKKIFEPIVDLIQGSAYEDEIRQLKQSNERLTATIQEMRSLQDSPTKRAKSGGSFFDIGFGKPANDSSETIECLQKIVNNLTEVISEKDLLLENQKKMNKELAKRVLELESPNSPAKGF